MTSEEKAEKSRAVKRLANALKLYRIATVEKNGYRAMVLLRRVNRISFNLRGYD
jgi:hypothetical protein